MPRRTPLAIAAAFALLFASSGSLAQTTVGAPTVQFSGGQLFPTRFVNFGTAEQQNLGVSTRPQNLNPDGISFQDCITDQTLQFPLFVTNFDGQNLQAWATESGDCTQDIDRGVGGVPTCWLLSTGITGLVGTGTNETINVRVRDLVGFQNAPPNPATYVQASASACSAQPSFTAVPLIIYFIPVVGDTFVTGSTPLQYMVSTDLVGPPAPVGGASVADGDTLFVVSWTPNADSDTVGYDLYIDPPIGAAVDASSSRTPVLVCDEAGATSPVAVASASGDGGDDASAIDGASALTMGDATVGDGAASNDASISDAAADASCHMTFVSGASTATGGGKCSDQNLSIGTMQDAAPTIVVEDAETVDDAGVLTTTTTTTSGAGGISGVDPKFLVPTGNAGLNVSGESGGSFTITGLTNGVTYTVAVSAVDAFGNIGPPAINLNDGCDFPAPVNDFFTLYRNGGGGAGGLCALEAAGAPVAPTVAFGAFGAVCIGLMRRRRRRR